MGISVIEMKNEMSAFDILAIVNEMQPLVGGYLDKVFHWDKKNLLLRINIPNIGRREILLKDLNWIYVSKERPETPDMPSQFAVHLRKLLSNARILAIRQQEFDRIVVMDVLREKDYRIVIELFGEGNLLLVSENKIVNCLISKKWKHREIKPGSDYVFPPPRFNPGKEGLESFTHSFLASNSDVVRTLATAINLGGQYAEEVCIRATVDKDRKAVSLTAEEISRLYTEITGLLNKITTQPSSCVMKHENGNFIDVSPIDLKQYAGKEVVSFQTFSEAVQFYLDKRKVMEQAAVENPEIQRLERQKAQLNEAIERSKSEADSFVKQAEWLYANYAEASSFLDRFTKQAKGMKWEQLREFANNEPSITSLDPEKRTLKLKSGDMVIEIAYEKGLDENANLLYSRGKEARDKMNRSEEILRGTSDQIKEMREKDAKERRKVKAEVKRTKGFWFEAYKWFITSGGHLVMAGRDARTNDQLVKKHLTSTDRFAHADVHGAPSVVIKEGSTATEEELAQACVFALTHSKAWNAGIREGSAYWVLPDQVSKTPDAGAFVPRGAFIIRGKRNYVHHIVLELGIGETEHQGARKIMCGPIGSIEALSKKFAIIVPGGTSRSRISASLAHEFQVPEEEISRILPPGDLELREKRGFVSE